MRQFRFDGLHLFDKGPILLRIGGILIRSQDSDTALDQRIQIRCAFELDHLRRRVAEAGTFFQSGQIAGSSAAPDKSLLVEGDLQGVQFDRPHQRCFLQWHPALLPGVAKHEHVGCDGVAHQSRGDTAGIDEFHAIAAAGCAYIVLSRCVRELPIRILDESSGRCTG